MPWFFIKSKGNPEGETGKDEKKPWAVRLLYSCNIVYFVYVVSMKSLAILFSGNTAVIGLDGHKTPG